MQNKTLYLIYRALGSPLEALFTLLIFIVSKELNASVLQLTVLACAKPVVSLIAFLLNGYILGQTGRIKPFLVCMTLVGAVPCFFFPYVTNGWFYVASYALFMTALRSTSPAWIEIFKRDLGVKRMGNTTAAGSAINYAVVMVAPFLMSYYMDHDPLIWKVLFVLLAGFQILNIAVIAFLKVPEGLAFEKKTIVWKEGWNLIRSQPGFAQYQALFFLGGVGLVTLQPILPIYFKETLHLSYMQLTMAFSVCKGVAFVLSSILWARLAPRISLYLLNSIVNILSCLFIAFILASSGEAHWLFFAYLMYGAMQAGCEMSWNLSGPRFAKEKESTLYSSTNLAFVGIRGCICPFLGQWIYSQTDPFGVFIFCGALSFISILYALWLEKEVRYAPVH